MISFGARLDAALDARGSLCAGIDPHAALLTQWGLSDDAAGLERFALTCAEAIGPLAAVVKPQSAFFERFGSAGIAVLERTVRACRDAGALVILDVKRGDIGSTMAAYAEAYLSPAAPLACDCITVSPYLGVGSLDPAFDLAAQHDAGLLVLARTSNPESAPLQNLVGPDGRSVAQVVVDEVTERNLGAQPVGSYGLVVGATVPPGEIDLAKLNGPLLAPGVGAQGGTASDVRALFGGLTRHVLPSTSREILGAGPSPDALRDAVRRRIDDFAFLRN